MVSVNVDIFVSEADEMSKANMRRRDFELEKYNGFGTEISLLSDPTKVFAVEIPKKDYENPEVKSVMREELEKWEKFDAYEWVDDVGQEIIDTRRVVTKKELHDGQKVDYKARLFVRGFKESNEPRSDSPTASKETLTILTAIAANEGWEIESIDITSAFLQGITIPRDVFVKPPEEIKHEGLLWRLKKGGYGLWDASRLCYLEVKKVLLQLGCSVVSGDEAFFYYRKNGNLSGCVLTHVDDFYGGGDVDFKADIMDKIFERFKCSKREHGSFRFTGVDISKTDEGIKMTQNHYVDSLEEVKIDDGINPKRDLNKEEFKKFRKATGKLSWLAETTRPDLSYNVLEMSYKNKDAKVEDIKQINKVVRKAKNEKSEVNFKKVAKFDDLKVLVVTDGSYLKLEDKTKSVGGRFIMLS